MDALDIVKAILNIYGRLLSFIRICFVVTGLVITGTALFDLVQASSPQQKFFGHGMKEPTTGGALLKILIGGAFASLGYDGYIIGALGSSLFGGNGIELVTVQSYLPNAGANDLGAYIVTAVVGFTQLVGIIAVARGLYGFVEKIDAQGNATYRKAWVLIITGVLCVYVQDVHDVFVNTFGTQIGGTFFTIF